MGVYDDCRLALEDSPPSTLTALEREVLYARLRAFSVRVQYVVWNVAGTVLLYLFSGSLLNAYFMSGDYYIMITFHLIQIISFITYFLTSLSDPGHIDMNNANRDGDEYKLADWNKNIMIDPNNAPFNFCWRCKFVRPIRSKHCYDCDRCISKFDHHCPMVGNCVGGKNHRYFLLFLLSQSIVVIWAFQLSAIDLYSRYHDILLNGSESKEKLKLNAGLIFRLLFFICMFFAMFIVIGLCGFHCYLSTTNQTTYEMVKPHILEKWIKEENRRKKKWIKKHKKMHKNNEYHAVDVMDDVDDDTEYTEYTEESDNFGISSTSKRLKSDNYMISFHDGYIKNIYYFWSAKLKYEWQKPLKCRLKDDDESDNENDDDEDVDDDDDDDDRSYD